MDLGCGYGFLSVMLGMVSSDRKVTGIDYDETKIKVASQGAVDLNPVHFTTGDISSDNIPDAEVYILNDVLHYLPEDLQIRVLEQCMQKVSSGGIIIVRDADASMKGRSRYTRFTELQSTKIFRFNKTRYRLTYLPGKTIEDIAKKAGFGYARHDHARFTANITHIITRKINQVHEEQ